MGFGHFLVSLFAVLSQLTWLSFSVFASGFDCETLLLLKKGSHPSLEDIFSLSERALRPGIQAHRDRVRSANQILVGDVIWVYEGHLSKLYPSQFGSPASVAEEGEILSFTVTDAMTKTPSEMGWRGEPVFFIYNEKYGKLAIPSSFAKFFYWRSDYQERAPFVRGEWVQVGSTRNPVMDPRVGGIFSKNLSLGVFLKMRPDGNYLIQMTASGPHYVLSPRSVSRLNTGTDEKFDQAIHPFLSLNYRFYEGEFALVRLGSGRVTEVLVESALSAGNYRIRLENGKTAEVHGKWISKTGGDVVARTTFHRVNRKVEIERIAGLSVEKFFDGARKMVSHPDFKGSSDFRKLKWIVRFVNRFFKKSHQAAYDQSAASVNNLLRVGIAVCNHKAYVVENILLEAGFDARLEVARNPTDKIGHAWVVVRMPGGQTFYVDPGKKEDVLEEWKVRKAAAGENQSLAARYYLNPSKKIYGVEKNK